MSTSQASEGVTLHFRAGQPEDQAQIAEMTKTLWDGHDYLARVWNQWAEAPQSLLRVALLEGEIVATGRVVEQVPGGWWLEGVRVHPAHQGRGFATQLHYHLVELAFQQPGIRWLGLTTASDTKPMAHLAAQSGMSLRAEYRYLRGRALPDPVEGVTVNSTIDSTTLLARIQKGLWFALTGGHALNGWVARPLDEAWLGEMIAAGGVWRCGDALALAGRGAHGREHWLYLLDGGSEREQEVLVRHLRHLAYQGEAEAVLRCFVPLDDSLLRPLLGAGMQDPYDEPFSIYHFVREQVTDAH